MAFGIAAPWGNTVASKAKLNLMTIPAGPGADLATLDVTKHGACRCTTTGSGFVASHFYISDGVSTWIDVSVTASHAHESVATGGTLFDIYAAVGNMDLIDSGGFLMFAADKAKWLESVTSTGVITNDTDGTTSERSIKLDSGATSGARASISMVGGVEMDFAKPSMWQSKTLIPTMTSLNLRFGFHIDNVTSADSTNVNYGVEICTATNTNWWTRSANGTATSASDTTIAATTNRQGITILGRPDLSPAKILTYIDANAAFSKTSNVPISGGGGVSNIFRYSHKNSTGSSRTLFTYATRVRYYAVSNWV